MFFLLLSFLIINDFFWVFLFFLFLKNSFIINFIFFCLNHSVLTFEMTFHHYLDFKQDTALLFSLIDFIFSDSFMDSQRFNFFKINFYFLHEFFCFLIIDHFNFDFHFIIILNFYNPIVSKFYLSLITFGFNCYQFNFQEHFKFDCHLFFHYLSHFIFMYLQSNYSDSIKFI